MEKVKLLEAGVDGGGFDVYRMANGKVEESGSSGGMMDDEEEDPIISWSKPFDSFELWWENFKKEQRDFWICFYPVFIHDDIKPFIRTEIEKYQKGENYHPSCSESWLEKLDRSHES